MKKLSVVLSVYNEESLLEDCLQSVQFADEIVVVNNSSTDNTESIARKYTSVIITQKNNPLAIDLQKNTGFEKATGEWILSLDADERVTPELRKEIEAVLKEETTVQGYWIPRKNMIFGKWIEHGIWWPDYQLRLFRKGNGMYPEDSVHKPLTVTGETKKLHNAMLHINYTSVSQYINKLNGIYTENEAMKFIEAGKTITWVDAIAFPLNDFLKTFFLQKGYRDGLHGLVLSMLQAFYMEVVFAKIWEKQGFPKRDNKHFLRDFLIEVKKVSKDWKYWVNTAQMENQTSKPIKILYKVKRKLRI